MKSTTPNIFLTLIICIVSFSAFTQNGSNIIWQETVKPNTGQSKNPLLEYYPKQNALYYQLNIDELKSVIENAPKRETIGNRNSNVILQFPNSKGVMESFRIVEASTMTPELQQLYPNIRSYAGQGIDNPSAIIRFSLSFEKGLSSMVLSNSKTVFIEPFTDDLNTYIVYTRSASEVRSSFVCETEYVESRLEDFDVNAYRNANDGMLRTFRLALACTGEYAQFHGGTVANVMAAMNTTMTRVNGVFERDVALTMVMVNNTSIIFMNGATDPYTNNMGFPMLAENQTECDNTIGSANYDIGHVFSTGGGGIASLRSPCSNTRKAQGVTGQGNPVGDTFDIDYVAHEMGHQYGGNHTQNNPCNRSAVSVEPGSASTIMGYAGICAPNVQGNSDDYFHGESIKEMWANISSGPSSACAVQSSTGNTAPVADAGINHTIPISTPFVLRGLATDVNSGDALTYCWEQVDTTPATMPPVSSSTNGPAFRSLIPKVSPNRYMPDFATVLAGLTATTWEVVPSVSRTMDFSLIVRDNVSGGGNSGSDSMTTTSTASAGPFIVTSQGSAVTWNAGSSELITWNVAGTTANGVNTANVNILLTTDAGATFTTLLANTPNDGSQAINVPSLITSTARIIVEGAGNIFYNVNAADITIQSFDFVMNFSSTTEDVCAPNNAVYNFTYNTFSGFSGTTNFSASGNPAGTTVTFSPTSAVTNGTVVTVTISGITNAMVGAYPIAITGTSGAIVRTVNLTLNVFSSALTSITLISPANGAVGVGSSYNLSWNADPNASNYDVEIATDATFSNIVETQNVSTNSYTATALVVSTQYYWRVRPNNSCATGSWSSVFNFTTASIDCYTFNSTDTPLNIPDNNGTGIGSTINVPFSVQITDINVTVDITHPYDQDLVIRLYSPLGTFVNLSWQNGGNGNNYTNTVFDDAAGTNITAGNAPFSGTFQPEDALSVFNSEFSSGNWQLRVYDIGNLDTGTIDSWSIEICGDYNCLVTTTWDGTSWDYGNPSIGKLAILDADYTTSVATPSFEACTLVINSNNTLTISSGDYVKVQTDLTVANNAVLEIEHEGSLVMSDDSGSVTNTGITNVHKTTPSYAEYDYTYWSSPVIGETIGNVFAANPANRIYYFNTSNFNDGNNDSFDDEQNDWYNASGTINPGIGLIAMGQGAYTTPIGQVPYPTYTQSVVFSGEVNNGIITVDVDQDNDLSDSFINQNLIGNPYPSAIDPQLFIQANSLALEGTLYFWTHRTFITASSGPDAYNFTNADYNSYNLSGMVASGAGQATPLNFKIASGQGFFANVDDASIDVIFNNSMRVNTENNSFYRTNENVEQDRIWINLIGEGNIFRQLLVAFFDNTTEEYDKLYDGPLLDSGNDYSFYSIIENDKYVIQARETFNNNQIVPLGFKTIQSGNLTISINNMEGVLNDPNTNVFIEDKELNVIHNLKTSDYTFYTNEAGVFNDRLELKFDNNTLGIDELSYVTDQLIISETNDLISVYTSKESTIKSIKVYDLLSRLLIDEKLNSNLFNIESKRFNSGTVLIFQVELLTGEFLIKKFISR